GGRTQCCDVGVDISHRDAPYQRGAKPASANWLSTSLTAAHITSSSARPSGYLRSRFERRVQSSYVVCLRKRAKASASSRGKSSRTVIPLGPPRVHLPFKVCWGRGCLGVPAPWQPLWWGDAPPAIVPAATAGNAPHRLWVVPADLNLILPMRRASA